MIEIYKKKSIEFILLLRCKFLTKGITISYQLRSYDVS